MTQLKDVRLILFFTWGMSLKKWDEVGMLEREVEIYRRLRPHLGSIAFFTYGDESELRYAPRVDGIKVLCNRWGLPTRIYARLAPFLYWRQMREADIFKTNQANGAEVALLAKRLFQKEMIARCGYMWSLFAERRHGPDSGQAQAARSTEGRVFQAAECVVVTTESMKCNVVKRYQLSEGKVTVIPNYVLTEQFKPASESNNKLGQICFIGRLVEPKNLFALLEAVKNLDVELVIIGGGHLREPLEAKARDEGIKVIFLGNRPYTELSVHLNRAELFILPSLYEGHPKTLLEAMACGRPVIGTDVPGIRELIEHRQTGFLCGTSPAEIRAGIQEVLRDEQLKAKMGRQAREFVVENFSIDRIFELELNLLQSLVENE